MPCEGELYYRGIRIQDLVQGFVRDGRKGYEEKLAEVRAAKKKDEYFIN